jgi:hypothetical protein
MPHSIDWKAARDELQQSLQRDGEDEEKKQIVSEYLQFLADLDDLRATILRKQVGADLTEMSRSRADTLRFLQAPDATHRCAALLLIEGQWGPAAAEIALYRQLALSDSDAEVRALAISCLDACYAGTGEAEGARLFASIVRNDRETELIRAKAYRSLLQLQGRPVPKRNIRGPAPGLPQDVDWLFVDSFLKA